MAKELGPQNLEELLIQAERVDILLNKATTLLDNPGGVDWPERFQAQNMPEETFFEQSRKLVGVAEKIRENSIPNLTKRKDNIVDQQIAIVSNVEAGVEYVKEQVNKGNLSPGFLERGQAIFSRIKAKLSSPPPEQVTSGQAVAAAQDGASAAKPTEKTQEMLVIPGFNSIPKKRFYTSADYAAMVGEPDRHKANKRFYWLRQKDKSIMASMGIDIKNRTHQYEEEPFLKIIEVDRGIKKRKRRSGQDSKSSSSRILTKTERRPISPMPSLIPPRTNYGQPIPDDDATHIEPIPPIEKTPTEIPSSPQPPTLAPHEEEVILKMQGVMEKQLIQLLLAKEDQGEIAPWDDIRALYPGVDKDDANRAAKSLILHCRRKFGRVFEIYNERGWGYGIRRKVNVPQAVDQLASETTPIALNGDPERPQQETIFESHQTANGEGKLATALNQEHSGSNQVVSLEQQIRIRQETTSNLTFTLLNNLVDNTLGSLTTRPENLLEQSLPPGATLQSAMAGTSRKQKDEAFIHAFTEKLQYLHYSENTKSLSEKDQQSLDKLIALNMRGRDIGAIVRSACQHFLIPVPHKYH